MEEECLWKTPHWCICKTLNQYQCLALFSVHRRFFSLFAWSLPHFREWAHNHFWHFTNCTEGSTNTKHLASCESTCNTRYSSHQDTQGQGHVSLPSCNPHSFFVKIALRPRDFSNDADGHDALSEITPLPAQIRCGRSVEPREMFITMQEMYSRLPG